MTGFPGTFWAIVWTVATCAGVDEECARLVLDDTHNYTQTSSLTLGRYAVQPAPPELTIDWADLTEDMRGRPVVPADVDQVYISRLSMSEDEFVEGVVANDIPQSAAVSATWGNGERATVAELSEFDLLGTPFDLSDLVAEDGTTWLITLVEIPEGTSQQDVLTTAVLDVVDGGATEVHIESGVSAVSSTPDLHTSPPIPAPAGLGCYTLDWSGLETDVFGRPLDNLVANRLVILNYPGSVADAEADFLLLDYHAAAVYALDVFGMSSARLEQAVDADGASFPGFSTDGTWLVGLVDDQSLSPVPLVMAVVEVE